MRLPVYAWKKTLRNLHRRFKTPPAHGNHPHHGQPRGRTTAIEPLQDRNLLSGTTSQVDAGPLAQQLADALAAVSSPVVYHLADGGSRANFDGLSRVQLTADGSAPSGLSQLPMPQAVEFVGADNVDNTLALDMGALANSPINTVVYQGGSGGYDTLTLGGGSFKHITYTATGKDSGILTYSSLDENQPNKTVIFTGLEPVIDTDSGDLTITATSGDDEIHIVDGEDQYDEDSNVIHTSRIYEASANFEEVTFGNKSQVEINCLGGNDHVSVEATQLLGLSTLVVNGGDGDDTLDLSGITQPIQLSAVTIDGGAGDDVIYCSYANTTAYGDAGNDQLFGGALPDGTSGHVVDGYWNTMYGGAGDDWLAGAGTDNLHGGDGNDELDFFNTTNVDDIDNWWNVFDGSRKGDILLFLDILGRIL